MLSVDDATHAAVVVAALLLALARVEVYELAARARRGSLADRCGADLRRGCRGNEVHSLREANCRRMREFADRQLDDKRTCVWEAVGLPGYGASRFARERRDTHSGGTRETTLDVDISARVVDDV